MAEQEQQKRDWEHQDQAPGFMGHWGTANARHLEGLPPCCLRHFIANWQNHELFGEILQDGIYRRSDQMIHCLFLTSVDIKTSTTTSTNSKQCDIHEKAKTSNSSDLPIIMGKVLIVWRILCFCWFCLNRYKLQELSPPLLTTEIL